MLAWLNHLFGTNNWYKSKTLMVLKSMIVFVMDTPNDGLYNPIRIVIKDGKPLITKHALIHQWIKKETKKLILMLELGMLFV